MNGSTRILRKVRYRVDENNRRLITSCIVELPDISSDALPNLPPKHIAVLPNDVEMKSFRHPNSGHTCTLRRYQVPLDAAFAITAHKAQGQTIKKVVVDLASCIGTEAAYVMVSRCTSLQGLMVLRPFPISKITVHRSQDAREEFHRLDRLNIQTIVQARCQVTRSSDPSGPDPVSQITALFSSSTQGPLDAGSARQLLNRVWNNNEQSGMFPPPAPKRAWSHSFAGTGPKRHKRKVPLPDVANERTPKRTKHSS